MPASRKRLICLLVFVFLYFIFMTSYGCILMAVEKPFEAEWREDMKKLKNTLRQNECVSAELIDELIHLVEKGGNHGFSSGNRELDTEDNWTFGSSFFFTISIGTTIGYGHLAPGTNLGKGLTALLSILGVPFTIILTTGIASRLLWYTRNGRIYLEKRIGERLNILTVRILHLLCVAFGFLALLMVVGGMALGYTEPHWSFLDSFYFTIISLSTVGLGDIVPGDYMHGTTRDTYLIIISLFLIVGVTLVMLVLETYLEIPELGVHTYLTLQLDESDRSSSGKNEKKSLINETIHETGGYGSSD